MTHGNVYLRKTIMECAWAAGRNIFSIIKTDFTPPYLGRT
nr:hypothetical protein [Prevotella denticola]